MSVSVAGGFHSKIPVLFDDRTHARRRVRTLATFFLLSWLWAPLHATSLPHSIVFVKQVPVDYTFATISDIFGNFEGYYPPSDQPVGGNLFRLDPDGTVVNLTRRSDVAVRDPEVSYDASTILFSMKTGGFGKWQVYEIGVDGTNMRKISLEDHYNDLDPSYMPDGRILFTSDRSHWADSYENLPSAQVATMNADGTGVEVLKHSPGGHFNPQVGSDGMVYLTQWDLHDRRRSIIQDESDFDTNRFLLWQIQPDGSGLDHPLFGAHTLYDTDGGYVEVREIPQSPGTYLGVLADTFFTFGGGTLIRIEPQSNQNLDQAVPLTENVFGVLAQNRAGRWRSPYPLSDGRIVASYAPGAVHMRRDGSLTDGVPQWRLVVMNADGSDQTTLFEDRELWSWQPVEVTTRPTPPVLRGQSKPQYPYALLNSFDVTFRGVNEGQVLNGDFQGVPAPGEVKTVRVYREDVRSPNFYSSFPSHADPDTELLGEAPVYDDGSFAVLVPADTPVTWELLDGNGKVVVRERYGTELRAGEVRQCDGCHTPHEGGQSRTTNLALATPQNLSGQDVDRNKNGTVDLLEHGPCEPGATNLCLGGGRFEAEVSWKTPQGQSGRGKPKPLTDDTGYFWFFQETNVELVVKVLDGRGVNDHFWVFYGALSDVEYTLTVRDTESGATRSYFNPAKSLASVADNEAFGPFTMGASGPPTPAPTLLRTSQPLTHPLLPPSGSALPSHIAAGAEGDG